jgi:hypothetical protein
MTDFEWRVIEPLSQHLHKADQYHLGSGIVGLPEISVAAGG